MQRRDHGPGVHEQLCLSAVDRAIHKQVEAFAHVHRHLAKSAKIQRSLVTRKFRIAIQNQDLVLAIHHCFGREEHVDAENSVDFLLAHHLGHTRRRADIGKDDRDINDIERAETEIVNNSQFISHAVDDDAGWEARIASDSIQMEIIAPLGTDQCGGRARIDH